MWCKCLKLDYFSFFVRMLVFYFILLFRFYLFCCIQDYLNPLYAYRCHGHMLSHDVFDMKTIAQMQRQVYERQNHLWIKIASQRTLYYLLENEFQISKKTIPDGDKLLQTITSYKNKKLVINTKELIKLKDTL